MMKQLIAAAGLCTLALVATPAAAQVSKDNVRTAREHGSGTSAREHGSRAAVGRRLSDAPQPTRAGHLRDEWGDVPGEAAQRPSRRRGGVRVAAGDVNGDGATSGRERAGRMQSQNNLKQMGVATQH